MIDVDEVRKAMSRIADYSGEPGDRTVVTTALDRLEELEKGLDNDVANVNEARDYERRMTAERDALQAKLQETRAELHKWRNGHQLQTFEEDHRASIGRAIDERNAAEAKLEAIHLELSFRTRCATTGDNALTMIETLAAERDEWKRKAEAYDQTVANLNDVVQEIAAGRDRAKDSSRESHWQALLLERDVLKARVEELDAERDRLAGRVTSLSSNLYIRWAGLRAAEAERDAMQRQLAVYEANRVNTNAERDQLRARIQELEARREIMGGEVEEWQQNTKTLRAQLETAKELLRCASFAKCPARTSEEADVCCCTRCEVWAFLNSGPICVSCNGTGQIYEGPASVGYGAIYRPCDCEEGEE